MTRVLVLDAQGGGMGRAVVEQLKKALPDQPVTAVGTNAAATAAMLKAGADQAATGENAVRVNAAKADLIIAPIGMVLCDSMLGEVTAGMALAVGSAPGHRILIPAVRCGVQVAGLPEISLTEAVAAAVSAAVAWLRR